METLVGILIPFIGTTLGAFMVFFMKNDINKKLEKILLGFASGVMVSASIWSLIIPSIELSENQGLIKWFPSAIGFLLGILFLMLIDYIISKINKKCKINRMKMLFTAVTLHNIPEGMAVGVVFSGLLYGNPNISIASAFVLAIGIAIQNFPEGAIISMPLRSSGMEKSKAFLYGVLSGIVEPISAVITILLTNLIVGMLPYLLAFAAGAMLYVVINELIPESQNGKKIYLGTIGFSLGFLIMMILDVVL